MKIADTLIKDQQWITQWSPERTGDYQIVPQANGVDRVKFGMAPDVGGDMVLNGGMSFEVHADGSCRLLSYNSYLFYTGQGYCEAGYEECRDTPLASECSITEHMSFRIRDIAEDVEPCVPSKSISDLVGCVGMPGS